MAEMMSISHIECRRGSDEAKRRALELGGWSAKERGTVLK